MAFVLPATTLGVIPVPAPFYTFDYLGVSKREKAIRFVYEGFYSQEALAAGDPARLPHKDYEIRGAQFDLFLADPEVQDLVSKLSTLMADFAKSTLDQVPDKNKPDERASFFAEAKEIHPEVEAAEVKA